jgi:hypothetical protein
MPAETPQELERIIANVQARLSEARDSEEKVALHNDSMLTWIVGLAGGALVATPSVLAAVNLKPPVHSLLLALSPWVFTVVLAVLGRIALGRFILTNGLFIFAKKARLETISLRLAIERNVDLPLAGSDVTDVLEHRFGKLRRMKKRAAWWRCCGNALHVATHLALGLGLVAVAVVVAVAAMKVSPALR